MQPASPELVRVPQLRSESQTLLSFAALTLVAKPKVCISFHSCVFLEAGRGRGPVSLVCVATVRRARLSQSWRSLRVQSRKRRVCIDGDPSRWLMSTICLVSQLSRCCQHASGTSELARIRQPSRHARPSKAILSRSVTSASKISKVHT